MFLTKYRPQMSSGSGGRRGKALKTAKKTQTRGVNRGVKLGYPKNKVNILVEHTWVTFLTEYRLQMSSGSGGRRGKALKTAKKT